jgi:hypothetical protein
MNELGRLIQQAFRSQQCANAVVGRADELDFSQSMPEEEQQKPDDVPPVQEEKRLATGMDFGNLLCSNKCDLRLVPCGGWWSFCGDLISTEGEHFSWELKLFLVAVGISAILGRWQRIIDMRSPVLPKAFEEDMPLFWVRHMKREEVINYLGGLLAKHIPARHISKIKAQAKSQEHRWFESTFWRGMLVGYQLIVLVVACLIFGFWMIWMHLVGRYHRLWLPACTITPKSGRGETALRRGMPTLRSGLVGVNYAVSRKSKSCGRRPLDNFKASIVESYGLRTDEAV